MITPLAESAARHLASTVQRVPDFPTRSMQLPHPCEADAYPPSPWELGGQSHSHLFGVARDDLPTTPPGFRPLVIAGHGLVVAGWVHYQEGILRYGEVFAAVVGMVKRRLTATVTHMWVDSALSRRGGRELWGYPKEMASFALHINPAGTAAAYTEHGELAHGSYRSLLSLPFRPTLTTGTMQPLDGVLSAVRMTVRGAPSIGRGTFSPGACSPLSFLASARRIASFGLGDFHATFG